MKSKILRKLYIANAMTLLLCNVISFIPYKTIETYGESLTKDSIGSVNMEDDGISIGVDQSQLHKTTYSDNIENEGSQSSYVYVSQASTFSVYVPKVIILDGKVNENGINKANYIVKVKGNISGTEDVIVAPINELGESDINYNESNINFYLKDSVGVKNDILATITQDKTIFYYNDILDENVVNGEISATNMTAGMWKGTFNFDIELVPHTNRLELIGEDGLNIETLSTSVGKENAIKSVIYPINTMDEVKAYSDNENVNVSILETRSVAKQVIIMVETNENFGCENSANITIESGNLKKNLTLNTKHLIDNDWTTIKKATCVEQGLQEKYCSICNILMESKILDIEPNNHNFDENFTIDQYPTMFEKGNKSQHCLNNGCNAITNIIEVDYMKGEYEYLGKEEILTILSTGIYQFDVYGAQGSNSTNYEGGKGGFVSFSIGLKANDIVKVNVGGQNGYNGGGIGTLSNGGGATTIYVNNELIAIAGGGGGATNQANGGNGGITIAGNNEINYIGESSTLELTSGGGAGYIGGTFGQDHTHIGNEIDGGECYQTPNYHIHSGDSSKVGGCYAQKSETRYKYTYCSCNDADDLYWPSWSGNPICGNCDHNSWTHSHGETCGAVTSKTPYTYNYIGLICGKTDTTIESYDFSCTKTAIISFGGSNYVLESENIKILKNSLNDETLLNIGNGKINIQLKTKINN